MKKTKYILNIMGFESYYGEANNVVGELGIKVNLDISDANVLKYLIINAGLINLQLTLDK